MIKKLSSLVILLFISTLLFPQSPGTFTYKGKSYLVFPYRISNNEEIPLLGARIPDGDYIAFTVYNFKENFSFKKEKTYHLTDTAIVAAIFKVKDNMAEGPAIFYYHHYSSKGSETKKPFRSWEGMLEHNLKTGVWAGSLTGEKPYDYTTYKQGLKHGYHTRYDDKGLLELKEKYCEGLECDTVYTFVNGKPETTHDVYDGVPSKSGSVYEEGMRKLELNEIVGATFYKQYDGEGKLMYELKFKNGTILPYDSIGVCYNQFLNYVTVKELQKGNLVLTYTEDYPTSTSIEKIYYSPYLSRTSTQRQDYKVKKNIWTGKKRRIPEWSSNSETEFIDPSSIEDSSLVPVLAEKRVTRYGPPLERYYIPRYEFAYDKTSLSDLKSIDTVHRTICLKVQTKPTQHDAYHLKYELNCLTRKQLQFLALKVNPYTAKFFIVGDKTTATSDGIQRYQIELRELETNPYYKTMSNQVYHKNDTLLNGMYYFSKAKKYRHWPETIHYSGYTSAENGTSTGMFVNGKKEGLWQETGSGGHFKTIPRDLKAYYFSHPTSLYRLAEVTYKDGMHDGLYIRYASFNPKSRDRNSKEHSFIFKYMECEYTRDTLNGFYREYYENNSLKKEMRYVMGSCDGECKEYLANGELFKITHFKKGSLEGNYTQYRDQKISAFANFKNNRLADSLVYYQHGIPRHKLYVKQDTLVKRLCYYYDGGLKEEVFYDPASAATIAQEDLDSDNYIELLAHSSNEKVHGSYRNYYDNGQLLSEGMIKNGKLHGNWKFYAINGAVVHEVNFADTLIHLPNDTALTKITGFYKGYYSTGVRRCTGYITDLELSYDCFTRQDKANFDFYAVDFFDINGKQLLKNGNGYFIKYDANGLRVSAGKLINCREDSLWKYYTPEQKLVRTGNYVNGEKDGVWYEGSLEGINFEDGACFDMNDKEAVKAFEASRKRLSITRYIYKEGSLVEQVDFSSDLNKTYNPQRGLEW